MPPTRVQLPDGNIGEFPEGMSTADIETVLQKQYPPPGPSQNPISQALDTTRNWIGQQKPVPPPGSGIDRPLTEIANMGNQFVQAIYDILPPNVANELYKKRAGLPNRLHEIPEEAVMTVAPMALGAEERQYTPGTAAEQVAARTPQPVAAAPGIVGTVARRLPYIGKYIRAADVLGDLLDAIKGKPETPPAPASPSVPAWWGKQIGRDIGPAGEWGQPNPASLEPVPSHVPTTDIIAANPGELARQQAAGVRGQAPLTVLPSENRGLALPPGPRVESPIAAEPLPAMPSGPSTIPRTLSGESALNQLLTGLDNKTLLKVARSRGIDVAKEAQLKPGVADPRIVAKIIDDFGPDELADIRDEYLEYSRMTPAPWAGSTPENWGVRLLQQFFPDAQINAAAMSRYRKALAQRNAAPLSTLLAVPNQ